MKTSICQYSYHRVIAEQKWSLKTFVDTVKATGADAVDFHVMFLPPPDQAAEVISEAVAGSGLELSGLSFSTDFNQDDSADYRAQIDNTVRWIQVAKEVEVSVSRVFGGHCSDRSDAQVVKTGLERIVRAFKELAPVAEHAGVVLAIENHGGLPCTGEEQAAVIEEVNSPFSRATVDVGNYTAGMQKPEDGTAVAAKYCSYVHLKDLSCSSDGRYKAAVLGEGDVDLAKCLQILKSAGYDGYVALEYEAEEDEISGVAKSIVHMKKLMANL